MLFSGTTPRGFCGMSWLKITGMALALGVGMSAAHAATTIVNLNASGASPNAGKNSGTATYNPVTLSLASGTYTVRVTGLAGGGLYDAMSVYAPTAANASYTDAFWTISLNNGTSAAYTQATVGGTVADFDGQFKAGRYNTAAAAFAAYSSASYTFTLAAPQSVAFYVDDNPFSDDTGGISLAVSQVPEPASLVLLGLGAATLLVARRRRTASNGAAAA